MYMKPRWDLVLPIRLNNMLLGWEGTGLAQGNSQTGRTCKLHTERPGGVITTALPYCMSLGKLIITQALRTKQETR